MQRASVRNISLCGVAVSLALSALACNYRPPVRSETPPSATEVVVAPGEEPPAQVETPLAADLLTVCMGQEPASLFLYADQSASARSIRQAIYDGPFDWDDFAPRAVILEESPGLANGGLRLEAVDVPVGQPVVDVNGKVVQLAEGVNYYPAGCTESACAAVYTAGAPAKMEALLARFTLKDGLKWSDGEPLTSADTVFAYNTARGLYPLAFPDLLDRTADYAAIDARSVEWRGLPGYRLPQAAAAFFTPLPQHSLGQFAPKELLAQDAPARQPLGWGPYMLTEWSQGDHITLARNPHYWRAAEGLPHFDKLVFRFMSDAQQAVNALQAGECDYLDESLHVESLGAALLDLQKQGQIALSIRPGSSWELLDFGLLPAVTPENGGPLPLFNLKQTRQAVAQCIDRPKLAQTLLIAAGQVPNSYVLPGQPLENTGVPSWAFDPTAGAAALEAAGWKDADANPATPRTAVGVNGVPDGAPLRAALVISDAPQKQPLATALQAMLADCGVQLDLDLRPAEVVYAAGPEGPIFGRKFALAQFGWTAGVEPGCALFTTAEIPGSYPEFPRGWGGANAGGYSNAEFDRLCKQALTSLSEWPGYAQAHQQAQAIFAEDLPAIPLLSGLNVAAARPDFCFNPPKAPLESGLMNLESFRFGDECQP